MRRIRKTYAVFGALALGLLATGCEPPPSPWHAERVNLDTAGNLQATDQDSVAISPDRTRIAFNGAADFVGDGQGRGVFIRDVDAGTVTRATTRALRGMSFSPDGTKLMGFAPQVPGGFAGVFDLMVADLTAGTSTTVLTGVGSYIGISVGGTPPPMPAGGWAPDSNRIVFTGRATVPGGPTALDSCSYYVPHQSFSYDCNDAYVHDLVAGTTAIVSSNHDGTTESNVNVSAAQFTPDGTKVLYVAAGNQVAPGVPHGTIYLQDLATGDRTNVDSVTGMTGNISSDDPSMSPDGTKVLFTSSGTTFGPTDTNANDDVYTRDLTTGTFALVSTNAAGTNSGNNASRSRGFSPDGHLVLLVSWASDLGPVDSHPSDDFYVRDLAEGTTELVTTNADCTDSSAGGVNFLPAFSPDSRNVLFHSDRTGLGATDENNAYDVYVHDLDTCTNNLVSARADGKNSGNALSLNGTYLDGGRVVFRSGATNIVPDDTNGIPDLFVATLHGADLAITGSGDWNDGQQAYDLEVVNNGPDTAEAAKVVLKPPPNAEFHSGSPACVDNTDKDVIECALGDLATGASVDVHITLAIPEPPGSSTVSAIADTTTFDYDGRNDTVTFVSD